ncbi:hypothetical protein AB5J56_10910 [Streptomyces sp. R21]|uniref:Uncharacterized protein n=1 Tax=Streptomyces sp. R21 TaxID=3238627 RepID=A0AB39P7Q2_9ACTN
MMPPWVGSYGERGLGRFSRGMRHMIEATFPELPEESLSLALDRTGRAGEPVPAGPPLDGRVSLGGPFAVPVTPAYVAADKDLAAFVEQESARARYHVVHLAVTVAPEPRTPRLDSVQVELGLSPSGGPAVGAGQEPPIAWSMTPSKISHEVEIGTSLKIGPQLKIGPVQATLGEAGRTRTARRSHPLVEALGELSPQPRWVMRATKDAPLSGSQRLIMVIRVPIGMTAELLTTMHASVMKGSILRRYVRQLPGPLSLSTVV